MIPLKFSFVVLWGYIKGSVLHINFIPRKVFKPLTNAFFNLKSFGAVGIHNYFFFYLFFITFKMSSVSSFLNKLSASL
jgi:hypothetical protein